MRSDPVRPEDMTAEALIALGFTTTLREHDALCDLQRQYARAIEPPLSPLAARLHRDYVWLHGEDEDE